jgi:hypothetical protein
MASDTEVTWVAMEHASSGSRPSAERQPRYYRCAHRVYNSCVNTKISPTFHVTHEEMNGKEDFCYIDLNAVAKPRIIYVMLKCKFVSVLN